MRPRSCKAKKKKGGKKRGKKKIERRMASVETRAASPRANRGRTRVQRRRPTAFRRNSKSKLYVREVHSACANGAGAGTSASAPVASSATWLQEAEALVDSIGVESRFPEVRSLRGRIVPCVVHCTTHVLDHLRGGLAPCRVLAEAAWFPARWKPGPLF